MKKITTIFFLLFICTGCVQSKSTGVQNISEPISMMTGGHMFTASQSLATNNGVYYISNIGQNNNLFYADYNSGKTWFLCSTPGCDHTTEQCSSYVSGSGYVFAGKEKLFYLTCENNKQIIYKMDLSGDNKTKIIPKKAMHYEGAHICGNDDILFTIYNQELVSISAENGEVNTLLHFDTNSEIISAYNNCIYLKKDMPNKYEDQMIPDKFEITEFNVNTGTEKRVYLSHDLQIDKIEEWYIPRLDTAYEFQDEIMYYLERSEGAIHKFNMIDQTDAVLVDLSSQVELKDFAIEGVTEHYIILCLMDEDIKYCSVDIDTGKLHYFTLERYNRRYDCYETIVPSFIISDKVIFLNGGKKYNISFTMPDGITETVNTLFPFYAFIKDKDLFENNNYFTTMELDEIYFK